MWLVSPAWGRAQEAYTGSWQAGETSMDVVIESWGQDCGPRPASSKSAGGGQVRIEQDGRALVIRSAGRDVRTDQCWSPNPAMRRQGTSFVDDLWTTRCKTPASDPREESGVYSLKALAEDRLLYQDVSRFNWKLKDSSCRATITTTQTLHRIGNKTASPTAVKTPCVPGPAKRLLLRPRSAEIELGGRACFEPRVLDAKGCLLKDAPVTWSLTHGKAIKARLEGGCLIAGKRSAESEGTFTVTAAHMGLRAEADVAVSATSLPSLLAKRLETGAIQGFDDEQAAPSAEPSAQTPPTAAAAAATAATAAPATRVSARAITQTHDRQRFRWLALGLALLALVGAVLLLWRRASNAAPAVATSTAPPSAPPAAQSRGMRCPKCGALYPEEGTFCGEDGTALVRAS